jgi:hypothetical protein
MEIEAVAETEVVVEMEAVVETAATMTTRPMKMAETVREAADNGNRQ